MYIRVSSSRSEAREQYAALDHADCLIAWDRSKPACHSYPVTNPNDNCAIELRMQPILWDGECQVFSLIQPAPDIWLLERNDKAPCVLNFDTFSVLMNTCIGTSRLALYLIVQRRCLKCTPPCKFPPMARWLWQWRWWEPRWNLQRTHKGQTVDA